MLIQNASGATQFFQPARFSGGSEQNVHTAKTKTAASVPTELPNMATAQISEQQLSGSQLKNAVDNINKFLQQSNKSIRFSVDTDTQKTVVKLVDSDTGDVLRQYPSKEMLEISKSIENMQQGMLLKQHA